MRTKRILAVAGVLSFMSTRVLAQEEHPNRATGERSETLYAQSGQDAVNVFNGSLSYRIPIGEGVQAGPNLRLAPVLVFNSTPLRNWNLGCNTPPGTRIQESYPSGDRIFSHGWQMHFGRVVPVNAVQLQALIGPCGNSPQAPSGGSATQSPVVTMNSTLWGYQEPDGAVHEFFDRQSENVPPAKNCWTDARATGEHCFVYTHDGSFLRMDPRDPEYGAGIKPVVYFPDGTRRVMGYRGGRTLQNFTAQREDLFYADIAPDFAQGNFLPPAFHATEIADPFGNKILVQYYGDGTAPAHPLAAYGVPQNQWDAIPYRAYADSYPAASYYFDVWVGTYSPIVGGPAIRIPFVWKVRTPTSSTQASTAEYTFAAGLQTGPGGPSSITYPILQAFQIPAGLSYAFAHALPNQPPFVTQITLPSGGLIQYEYTDVKLATKQPNENCSGAPSDCYLYQWDTVTGVSKRRTVRNIRTTAGGTTTPESAETTYFRTYLGHTDPVSQPSCVTGTYGSASCQMRVDQWTPAGLGSGWNVTRSTFYESDGYTNTALYGRPFQIDEFFPATTTTPSRGAIDAIASTAVRRTTITYDHDGLHLDPQVPNPDGHSHNTRETYRKIQWCGGAACGSQRYSQTQRYGWDGYGHFTKTVMSEAIDGTNPQTLKSGQEWHLNTDDKSATTRWVLDPVWRRTTSTDPSDTPPAAVSSTEDFTVDATTGFVQKREVTANDTGDSRLLRTTWTAGTQQTAPCLPGRTGQSSCNNRGFVTSETTQFVSGARVFGSDSETAPTTSFTRYFYYQYGSPSAWYDSGATFYGLDNDLSACGKVLASRGSEGRISLMDASPHSSLFEYDLLGRVTTRTPYGEWPETTTYAPQTATTKRCSDFPCSSFISTSKSYFDELGRPTVSLRSMPGANAWSYKVVTYDTAGRTVSDSQWQALTCGEADPCSTGTNNLLNLQAAISGSGSTSTTNIPGTIRTSFGMLGIPQYTISADGSLATSSFAGWWQVQTTRKVNQPAVDATYTYNRDALGRLTSVVEPATVLPDTSTCMNGADTTSYTYDAFDRLIQAVKFGTDASCSNSTTQTRTWAYDDFGWLVSEQTPEVPNYEVRQRDGRGNIVVECTGPTASCGPSPGVPSNQDRLSHCYDTAGRLLSSSRLYDLALYPRAETPHCGTGGTTASFEDFFYDSYSYPGASLNFGRSNGRLVYSVRHNLSYINHETVNLGWYVTEDLYQYAGIGDRLNQRQMSTFLIGGAPTNMVGRLALGTSKPSFSTGLADYFTAAKRKIKKHDEGLTTAVATTAGATPVPAGRVALDAYNPLGWFRWYWYYDLAGRPYQMFYPRRDETTRTWVQNAFDRGWLTSATVTLADPFNPPSSTQASAAFAYNPSGSQAQATVSANPGTQVYSLRTPDNGAMSRIGGWYLDRGAPTPGNPYGTGMEYRSFNYDGSGNVVFADPSLTYTYDVRSRLTKFIEYGTTQTRRFDSFGNLGRIDDSTLGTQIFSPEMATNRHVATGSGVSAAFDANRGNLIFDALQSRNVGRDYYADGRPMSEYGRTAGSYATVYPVGVSVYLLDARGERAMTFHGDGINCDSELFRQSIRDEAGRLLTDYKADNQGFCNCSTVPCQWTDRFERDYVWVGNYTQLSIKRADQPHFTSLDHLGSPRHQLDRYGAPLGINIEDAWGTQVSVNQTERTRFTGHERNNVDLDGPYLPISDYMHTRTYVPMLGRFTSPDPVSEFHLFNPQTANRYVYAFDSPARYTDPYGLRAEGEGEGSEGEENDPCSDPTSDTCQIAIAAAQTAHETVTSEPISPGLAAVIRGTQLAAPVVATTGALTLTFLTGATLGLAPSSYAGPLSYGLDIFNMQIGSRTLPLMPHAIKRTFQRGLGVDKVRDTVAAAEPFQYFHKGVWKTGYYDPASQVFVGEDGIVLTVMTKVKPGYIERLKAATP